MTKRKKIVVNVTAADIRLGKIGCPEKCPVARALGRHVKHAMVGTAAITYSGPEGSELPKSAAAFVDRFDMKFPVKPFRFTLSVPTKYLKRKK